MKKRNIIVIVLIAVAVVAVIAAVYFISKPELQPASADKPEPASTEVTPTVTLPEPGTVYVDGEKNISATIGVESADSELDEENPEKEVPTKKPEKDPEPTPTPTPAPLPEEPAKSSYEQFIALSSEQKDEFMHSFESMGAFFDWLAAAQEEYKNAHPDIEIGPGIIIDLDEFMP